MEKGRTQATKLIFPIMYQGYNNLDEREANYFTLSKKEALNYGQNVRVVMIELHNPLLKRSDDYYTLQNEFREIDKDHKWGDILDNSTEGIKRQQRFFDFLEKKGYDGITYIHQGCFFYPSSDSQYVVCFRKKTFKVLSDGQISGMASWFIKELNTHSTEHNKRIWVHNLKMIYENHNVLEEEMGLIKEKLEEEGVLDGDIPIEFYHKRLHESVLCCAKTLIGKKCTRKTLNGNGLCWQHND